MIAISDNHGLYLLEFMDRPGLEHKIVRLQIRLKAHIIPGITDSIRSVEDELKAYFNGKLRKFTTAIHPLGSPFQKLVWKKLCDIPYGQTWTYSEQAASIEKPTACRAVANANGVNQIAIVIPCHRVINSNGKLGGYTGGVRRKKWLIEHEKTYR
ncbi:methylated-DNA--[protein]-cysteine S-methyltransferase [Candidatus Phycorickettsia trachydisci]|nr:methylated-DNA--[protein]-cysteine S-methyltransferase [Candidatus Phycorickettsia trachydisci]